MEPFDRSKPTLTAYQAAGKRIRDEVRHQEYTARWTRWRQENPEMIEALYELAALVDRDDPPRPLPPLGDPD
jgi:hypothetical protein